MAATVSSLSKLPENSLLGSSTRSANVLVPDKDPGVLMVNANEATRPALKILSESANKALAVEAESVFSELLGEIDKDHFEDIKSKPFTPNVITDPRIIKFIKNVIDNDAYGFQEHLPDGKEVRFSKNSEVRNFSFYETRIDTAEAIAKRNLSQPLRERFPVQDTKEKVQAGMLTIYKFSDTDIRISVTDLTDFSTSITRGFSLAA
jgi:hypothetical protein